MTPIATNHLEKSAQKMYSDQDRLRSFMDHCDPQDMASWDTIYELTLNISGSTFAAQQEFKLEHFLAKNLISSI